MSSIPCLAWARRGATVGRPQRIQLTEDEIDDLVEESNKTDEDDDVSDNEDISKHGTSSEQSDDSDDLDDIDAIEKKYGLNDYDSDDDRSGHGLGMKSLIWRGQNAEDQYLVEDDEESEDAEIQPDDNILAIGRVKNELFGLEAYVYNEASSSLFCHHDTIMASFPLAMEWVGYDPGDNAPGNLLAVGTTKPDIELWDLDVVNTLEPAFVLAGTEEKSKKQKSRTSRHGHTDAVLALSWNTLQQNALASGSADFTIGLWDLEEGEMVMSIDKHEEKVQALQWHPFEKELLLSGSFDNTACVFDCRHSTASHKSFSLCGEVEKVTWNARHPFYFLASTDDGFVYCFDVRSDTPVFTVKAHKAAVTGLAISSELPGCMVTSSSDQLVKVWDIRNNQPDMVCRVNLAIGEIHSMAPCPDSGFIYAIGAETDLRIFHLKTSDKVLARWNLEAMPQKANRKMRIADSDVESSDSEDITDEDSQGEHSSGSNSEEFTDDSKKKKTVKKTDAVEEYNSEKQITNKLTENRSENTRTETKQLKKLKKSASKTSKTVYEFSMKNKKKETEDVTEKLNVSKKKKKKLKDKKKVSDDEEDFVAESTVDDRCARTKKEKKQLSIKKHLDEVDDICRDGEIHAKDDSEKRKRKKRKHLKNNPQVTASDLENSLEWAIDPDDGNMSVSADHPGYKLKKKKKSKKGHQEDAGDTAFPRVKKKCKT